MKAKIHGVRRAIDHGAVVRPHFALSGLGPSPPENVKVRTHLQQPSSSTPAPTHYTLGLIVLEH